MSNIVIIGTSRGIGKSLVQILAKDPNNQIYALSRKTSDELSSLPNVHYHEFDLNAKSVRQTAESIFKRIGQVDFLVNNAGKLVNKPFLEISAEELEACYQTNITGVFQTVQAAVPVMISEGGHILNISSVGGFQGSVKFSGLSAYSTSKAAICSFTELFSEEYKDSKIAMNCLCLGAVQTEMLEEAFPGYEAPLKPKEMAEYIADFLLNGHRYFKGKILPVSLSTP
jgi:3-oxoacyl-[acyl-carrier protein] reductase